MSIDKYSLKDTFRALEPVFFKTLSTKNLNDVQVEIKFSGLRAFRPDGLIKGCGLLRDLLAALEFTSSPQVQGLHKNELREQITKQWPYLRLEFDSLPDKSPQDAVGQSGSVLDDILTKVAFPGGASPEEASSVKKSPLSQQVKDIIKGLIHAIYSDPAFKAMEECWRGLWFMLKSGKWPGSLMVDLIPIGDEDLEERIEEYLLNQKNVPPDLMLIDRATGSSPRSFNCLERLCQLAEENLVPMAISTAPGFFHIESWDEMTTLPYLPHYLEEPFYAKWQHLRKEQSSRWLILLCNGFLLREPYDTNISPSGISFTEKNHLWGDPVWALGSLYGRSVARYGWPTCLSRYGIIYLDDMPMRQLSKNRFLTTRIYLKEDRLDQLSRCAIAGLSGLLNEDTVFLPVDTSVFGHSFSSQLMLGRVVHFILALPPVIKELELRDEAHVKHLVSEALNQFFNSESMVSPFGLKVRVQKEEGHKFRVFLEISPPSEIVSTPGPLVLDFAI